jgi:hypothetical protein
VAQHLCNPGADAPQALGLFATTRCEPFGVGLANIHGPVRHRNRSSSSSARCARAELASSSSRRKRWFSARRSATESEGALVALRSGSMLRFCEYPRRLRSHALRAVGTPPPAKRAATRSTSASSNQCTPRLSHQGNSSEPSRRLTVAILRPSFFATAERVSIARKLERKHVGGMPLRSVKAGLVRARRSRKGRTIFFVASGKQHGDFARLGATWVTYYLLRVRQTSCTFWRMAKRAASSLRDPRVPSPFNRRRLSLATMGISDAAIARAYINPRSVRESTLLRLQKAAQELGLPAPGGSQ